MNIYTASRFENGRTNGMAIIVAECQENAQELAEKTFKSSSVVVRLVDNSKPGVVDKITSESFERLPAMGY